MKGRREIDEDEGKEKYTFPTMTILDAHLFSYSSASHLPVLCLISGGHKRCNHGKLRYTHVCRSKSKANYSNTSLFNYVLQTFTQPVVRISSIETTYTQQDLSVYWLMVMGLRQLSNP